MDLQDFEKNYEIISLHEPDMNMYGALLEVAMPGSEAVQCHYNCNLPIINDNFNDLDYESAKRAGILDPKYDNYEELGLEPAKLIEFQHLKSEIKQKIKKAGARGKKKLRKNK